MEINLIDVGEELKEISDSETGFPCIQGFGLMEEQQLQLDQLTQKWRHVFSRHEEDYGRTDIIKHQIPTGTAEPVKERYRPVPPTLYKEIHSLLQGMYEGGVIRESSPWAAPIVLVKKAHSAGRASPVAELG